jgi:hypothetical protein
VSKTLAGYWRRYRALPTLQRELVTLGLMLLLALTLLPLVIFLAGQYFLGEYIRHPSGTPTGGFGAMWVDYLKGIGRGSFGYWLVLLGPWILLLAGRGMVTLAQRDRAGGAPRQSR